MSEYLPAALARLVRERAGGSCEYCRLPQSSQEAAFHIDHIQPRSAGGPTVENNLALACVTCSLRKAARTHARDRVSKQRVPLFHPRRDRWADHFRWTRNCRLVGRTPTGRATIAALGMNRPTVIAIRRALLKLGEMSLTDE
jgi:5-methylcytosine-specific restriction endonuclease McrA